MKSYTKYLVFGIVMVYTALLQYTEWYNSCFFNWLSLNHNQTTSWYKYSSIAYWSSYTCNTLLQSYENFICNNWIIQWQNGGIPSLYNNNHCVDEQPQWCMLWNIFWQQIYVPHIVWSPDYSQIWDYVFTWYVNRFVENINSCNLIMNSIGDWRNTYVYCKNWVLKDLVLSNILGTEQNFNQNSYPYTQCSQIRSSDCTLNNTIIKHGESATFYESNNSSLWLCNSQIRTCSNGVLSWNFYFTSCSDYNWICGSANGQYFTSTPLLNLCAAWSNNFILPLFNTTTHQWTWTCNGWQWSNETCMAYKKTEEQNIWKCKTYIWWAVSLSNESQFLCELWNAINFNETTLWRNRTCQTEYGVSNQCSTKKVSDATWKITYSYNWDWSITASVTNISPVGAYISNNNNSNSKRFTENWSFIFQLKFNESITNITAKVDTINNRVIKIQDLILDYKNNICNKQRNIKIKESSIYNLLDVQTMINHCILIPKQTKWIFYINMKKTLTRWEFIKSIYNFTKTIRPYSNANNIIYSVQSNQYKWVPTTQSDQEAIKRLISIKWNQYIQHTKSNNTSTYRWNSTISTKEIYDTIRHVLNSHDDNDIYFKGIWAKENINSTMKREQYANIVRRILEQYDRVALWNSITSIENIEKRVSVLSSTNQQLELENIYNSLHTQDSVKFERLWISKRALLNDISTLLNDWKDNKKSVITISLQDVIDKTSELTLSSINQLTKQQRSKELFKKMNY